MKLAVIREGKVPTDERVPLTPGHCRKLSVQYPELEVVVQKSPVRAIPDADYMAAGIKVVNDVSDCDVLMGVKEVPVDLLIPGKTYFFFSHTIKEQPYNRKLLQAIIAKKIRMVDYETLTNKNGLRLVGFGRYAGIVGTYNGFLAYGKKTGAFDLKRAHDCIDRKEVERELKKVVLPKHFKIVLTGAGRVGGGAVEILHVLGIKEVTPSEFLADTFDLPVYTQLNVEDYNARPDRKPFERPDFYNDPRGFISTFPPYLKVADMYVTCHFWDAHAPYIFRREDLLGRDVKTKIVADISCDVGGPIPCTLRASTIDEPFYGYDPVTGLETDFLAENSIVVMAVDNLPCELPRDASMDFGNELLANVIPHLLGADEDDIIARATIAENGKLTAKFAYLQNYLEGVSV